MARVEIASMPWGVLQDRHGESQNGTSATLKNLDGTNATTWSAITGGSSSTSSLTADSNGNLPRFVEGGQYTLDVPALGVSGRRVEAVSGSVESGILLPSAAATGTASIDRANLVAWLDELDASGRPGFLVPGQYVIDAGIERTTSAKIFGAGRLSQIASNDTTKSVLYFAGANDGIISNIALVASASVRNGSQYGLRIDQGARWHIDTPYIAGTAAAGLFCKALTDSEIITPHVWDTLADGIHLRGDTGSLISSDVSIISPRTYNTGDAGVAVVGYTSDGATNERIHIINPRVYNAKANGVQMSGAKDSSIVDPMVNGTASNGVLISLDPAYLTFNATNVTLRGGKIRRVGAVSPTTGNQYGVYVTSTCDRITVEGVDVAGGTARGFSLAGTSLTVRGNRAYQNAADGFVIDSGTGLLYEDNHAEENGTYGHFLTTQTDMVCSGNVAINNNTAADGVSDNFHFAAIVGAIFGPNYSIDNRGTKLINRTYEFSGTSSGLKGLENLREDATGKTKIFGGSVTNLDHQTVATDANFTLTPETSPAFTLHTGTLTADRTVTLSTSNGRPGLIFKVTRTGGGAFNLNVGTGPLKAMAQNTWAEFEFNGSAWMLSAHGDLLGPTLVPTVASAATIAVPSAKDVFIVSGTTNIDTITATNLAGRQVTIIFSGILTVGDGTGNLKLSAGFTTTADDTLRLVCDGTSWYEVSRSVN